jgi:hypothetical protein
MRVRSGEYSISPLVKAWRHQQIRNTQAMRLRDTKGQALTADRSHVAQTKEGDSDAHMARGLITILFAIYSGRCADEIVRTDAQGAFRCLGLAEHLTSQRSNGFASMVERICTDSRRAIAERRGRPEPRTAPVCSIL